MANLYIPVFLGTVRKGRMSEHAARIVHRQAASWPNVESELIDIRSLPLPVDDAGEAIKDAGLSQKLIRADALIVVTPEYNRGAPGLLKHVLDAYLEEYVHKAVGIVGVSAGSFGGTRVIESLLSTFRELGLVTIFWDVNVSSAHKVFDDKTGELVDASYLKRIDKFLAELVWMARTLRHGRESITLETR